MTDALHRFHRLLCALGLHQWRPTRIRYADRCRRCGQHRFRSLP